MPPPAFEIRQIIDTNTPVIYPGNWEAENRKGWRWEANLNIHDINTVLNLIKMLQADHGRRNVAIGHTFNFETMKPEGEPLMCGLYLRDAEDIVQEAMKELDDLDALERFFNNN